MGALEHFLNVSRQSSQRPRLGYGPGLDDEKLLKRLKQDESRHSAVFDLLREAKTWTFGADVVSRTVYEDEDFLVSQVAKMVSDAKTYDFREDEAELTSRIPAHKRDEFHHRFKLAVDANPIREDRFAVHQRATALLRVAILEVGQRAKGKGCLKEAEHALAVVNHVDLSNLLQLKEQDREAQCVRMEKAYGRLLATCMAEKGFVPESLPLEGRTKQKKPSQSSTSTLPEHLFKLSGYLPEISLLVGVEMLWDWKHLDQGHVDVPVLKAASPEKHHLLGMSVDDLAGQVEGIARVDLPGLQLGEILVVKETSASYVKYFPRLRGLVMASAFTLATLS